MGFFKGLKKTDLILNWTRSFPDKHLAYKPPKLHKERTLYDNLGRQKDSCYRYGCVCVWVEGGGKGRAG